MSHKDHHSNLSKSSSQQRRFDDERNRLTTRTVIYEEPSSTTTRTLKSSVRQVIPTSSFYNTSTSTQSQALIIRNGKQSTTINSDLYNSEIVDVVDDDDDHLHHQQHFNNEDRNKRRRTSSSDSSSTTSDEDSKKHSSKEKQRRTKRNSSKDDKSPAQEREEGESISDRTDEDDGEEKDQRRIPSSTDDHSNEDEPMEHGEEAEEGEEEEEEPPPPRPGRSRFDDHEEQDQEENRSNEDENENDGDHHRHRRHRHHRHQQQKRSRRRSSSTTPQSSSSKSALTPPNSNQQIEKDFIEEKPKLPNYYPAIQGCRRVDEYKCLNRIEEGAYGVVFRAKDVKTGDIVALKRLKMEKEKEGFPITSLREICCILKAQHENVCTVREIVVGDDMNRIFIVMDYVEHDLKSLMTHTMRKPFAIGEVKTLMHQLLSGVNHLHDNWIIHRDLKTSNLLLSNRGILKIGDFGLAREYGEPLKPYTPIVVTLWYRAPELLLGIKEYSTPIDVWSVGAIFGELLLMKPLFPGKSELDQLNRIFKDLGTPTEKIWPDYNNLPFTKKMNFSPHPFNRLRTRFNDTLSEKGFDLLNKLLAYDPEKRITALDALKHLYFEEIPRRIDPSMFPTWPSRSEEKDKSTSAILQRSSTSNTTTIPNEPQPPSAGKMYEKLLGGIDDDDESFPLEHHLPPPNTGFQLRG